MKKYGATDEQIAAYKAAQRPKELEVYPENWQALNWFLTVDDLFKYEQGICMGLDLTQIAADIQITGREVIQDDYKKLRFIGQHAAAALNKRAK